MVEFLLYLITLFVNKNFQWLIIEKDEFPKLSKEGLTKFIPFGYDAELGWVRKPNTFHTEIGKHGETKWTINSFGARTNPNFENLYSKISCYGDSFTFCRQVNDDETWEYYLSEIQKTNVLNFGVGNYGIDQTLLRLKREYPQNKTEVVIVGVVPDTISRILSVWKHYYEYGNTFGFKPRFILKTKEISLLKNPIDNESKFYNYKKYLDEIRKNDFFYNNKFKKEKIHFPYTLSIFKNMKRNFSIIYWVLRINLQKKLGKDISKIEWMPMKTIMRINLKWRINLFEESLTILLLRKIIDEFVTYSKNNNFKLVLVFLPQKDDVVFIKNNFHFYKKFVKNIEQLNHLKVIDITEYFINEKNLDLLYSDDNEYGGHFSREGNKLVATIINDELSRLV